MKLQNLIKKLSREKFEGYYYLASPYSLYKRGHEAAHVKICKIAAKLINNDINVFCPIAHSHSIATIGKTKKLDWLRFDHELMRSAKGIIVAKMDGWDESVGVEYEIDYFKNKTNRPVYYLEV